MAVYDEGYAPAAGAPRVTNLVNFAGAALSLALILGVSYWGYNLIVRDVSGIPVVRAIDGDMRVLPDDPGGSIADYAGLSVNEVAAKGGAGGPEDRLVLAPRTAGLAPEDIEAQPVASATVDVAAVDTTGQVVGSDADVIAATLAAISREPSLAPAQPDDAIAASVAGIATSLRPVARPASPQDLSQTQTAMPTAAVDEVALTTTVFPAGTNLVQLGAFPTPALAAQKWGQLQDRFGALIGDRARVIQVSNQSSVTWYRLRASGFADRAEARRVCAALQAENAECIAVVVN